MFLNICFKTSSRLYLQVKYDTLGKVKIQKRQTSTLQQSPTETCGAADETVTVTGPQCRLNCDCSLTSAGDERPRMAVDSSSLPQSLPSSQGAVTERRRPPPPPSTDRRECSCTTSNKTGSQVCIDDLRHHHHHCHHHGHRQPHQQQLEQFAHRQQRSQTSASDVRHQPQRHREGLDVDVQCSRHGDQRHAGSSSVNAAKRQCCSMLSNAELFQIDLFYRSRRTLVYVCPCPAVLYFARTASSGAGGGSSTWRFAAAGVPVIVVDTVGIAPGPRLHVVLAERGTGFELWRYGLTDVHQYAVSEASAIGNGGAAFHTAVMPSKDIAGLCFDDADSAGEFHRQLLRFDQLYSTGAASRSKKGKKTKIRVVSGACEVIA